MKNIGFIAIATLLFLNGCAQNSVEVVEYQYDSNMPVCAQIDGEKQTFPSMNELSNYSGASYLYDGPCYD